MKKILVFSSENGFVEKMYCFTSKQKAQKAKEIAKAIYADEKWLNIESKDLYEVYEFHWQENGIDFVGLNDFEEVDLVY